MNNDKTVTEETVFYEDELMLLRQALKDARGMANCSLTLFLRNGYIYRARGSVDYHGDNNNGKDKR